jgi:hypothetical protein
MNGVAALLRAEANVLCQKRSWLLWHLAKPTAIDHAQSERQQSERS